MKPKPIERDYSRGLTPQEWALLNEIRRAGYALMAIIDESQRTGHRITQNHPDLSPNGRKNHAPK